MGSGYRGAQLNTQLGGGATKHLQGVQEKCVLYSTIKKLPYEFQDIFGENFSIWGLSVQFWANLFGINLKLHFNN